MNKQHWKPSLEFELFAYPLTLCVINNGLIFFLHFSKKTIYFFLGKGAFLITYQKIVFSLYSFSKVLFEILDLLDKTCINTNQSLYIIITHCSGFLIHKRTQISTLKRSHIDPWFCSAQVNWIILFVQVLYL